MNHYNLISKLGVLMGTLFAAAVGVMAWSAMKGGIFGVALGVLLFGLFSAANNIAFSTLADKNKALPIKIYAFIVVLICLSVDSLATWHELGGGIQAKIANAAHVDSSINASAAIANSDAEKSRAMAECQRRYPTTKTAGKLAACLKPYDNLPQQKSDGGTFVAENAAESSQWQSIADMYNNNKTDAEKINVGQVVTAVMGYLGVSAFLLIGFLTSAHGDGTSAEHARDMRVEAGRNMRVEAVASKQGFTGFRDTNNMRVNNMRVDHASGVHASAAHASGDHASGGHATGVCDYCGSEYNQRKPWQRFCSTKCRDEWHNEDKPDRVIKRSRK